MVVSFVEPGKEGLYYEAALNKSSRSTYKFYKDPLCEHSRLRAVGVDTTGPED